MPHLTPLDSAHGAMDSAPGDNAARLQFFERLADSELFLLLTHEAKDENLSPEIFEVADGRFALAFDREERLARFANGPAPYAALSGRVLAQMLTGQAIGLGVNLDVAPSSILIPAEAVDWLNQTLGHIPDQIEARITDVTPPSGLPETLVTSLDTKLATATGLARCAYLVGVGYVDGTKGHLLAFVDAISGAESALAKAAGEALTFSGIEAGAMDVGFFTQADPVTEKLGAVGLRFDLPQPPAPQSGVRTAPGSDPDKPPILK